MVGNRSTGRSVVSQPRSFRSPGSRELAAPRGPHASGPALCPARHHPLHDLTTPHTGSAPGAADLTFPNAGPAPGTADPGPLSSVQGLLCLESDPRPFLSHVYPPNVGMDVRVATCGPQGKPHLPFPHWTEQDRCTDSGGSALSLELEED